MTAKLVVRKAAFDGGSARQDPSGRTRPPRRTTPPRAGRATLRQRAGGAGPSALCWGGLVVLATALAVPLAGLPAGANPGGSVPDSGSRPVAVGSITYPGQSGGTSTNTSQVATSTQPPVIGPLAMQIIAESRTVEMLGEQVKQANEDVTAAKEAARSAEARLGEAQQTETSLRDRADSVAADAFKRATALGPFESYASQLRDLSVIAPGVEDQPGSEALARRLIRAEEETSAARDAYNTISAKAKNAMARRDSLKSTFDQRAASLAALRARNATELARIEAEREAYEQSLTTSALGEVNADGMTASPQAMAVLRFALAQLGDPYVWGAEGPDQYDCSGLVWAAHRSVGVTLPRVASAQYANGPTVTSTRSARGDLLVPGDLVFFSIDRYDWTKIHHVGIYLGAGKMVHAPHTGDVVKISTVLWSEFFGAVRIFPAVPAAPPSPQAPQTSPATSAPAPSVSSSVPPQPVPSEPVPSSASASPVPSSEAPVPSSDPDQSSAASTSSSAGS
ncbi:MAG: hypothetical protein HKP61_11465 [Dactylosporangium sp.]|nr:C40 family peptidase [Dactylosporangium sp.]NNJ61544.1 hypothetical protein [Dactylosporangium sp.]